MTLRQRIPQFVLLASLLASAWLWMQIVHELGHVLGGLATGATIRQVVLHPLEISRTDFGDNPHPLIACWSGPLFGAMAPALIWLLVRKTQANFASLQFFAGFCLIANGAYLSVGAWDGIGDAGDLQKYGAPAWTLYLFGIVTIPGGLWSWHNLGQQFGIGPAAQPVAWNAAWTSFGLFVSTVAIESGCRAIQHLLT